ncbi:hypothetical protein B0A48_11684 [Cryoendolithus antarcticus]|uniref:U3 small nucleolar RNA-associated protein 15 C-terminal domain-containing protein n=1 Tax=Cryoendolithus antarcticus TaxID=1507870 RepID=A0A1V8STA9_9PEZI|nr:hypothetical protein B0A48_11684 [Cryoendolithus antarcticus]
MAAEVQALPPLRQTPGPAPLTPSQTYYRAFKSQLLVPSPHNSAITSITSPPSAETFAVTSGGRSQIYNSRTRKILKTITRFGVDDVARSGVVRRDGRILLAGGDGGVVQAFDTGSRAVLRQWGREEKRRLPVHVVRWSLGTVTEFMTCGDDRTVRVWDLTEEEPKWVGVGHEDYVRAGCWLPGQEGMVVSGGYDQTVRVWDTRQGGQGAPVMTFRLQGAVENVCALGSTLVAAAAGNEVSVLNLISGKPEVILRSHQKAVSALALAQGSTRLLTAGLDGHIKIHSTSTWEVVASLKYTAPILSLAVIPSPQNSSEDRHLLVGLQSGLLSIRTRLAGAEKAKTREREKRDQALIAGTADEYERLQRKKDLRQGILARDRGKDFRGEGADITIQGNDRTGRPKPLKPWQQALRRGEYSRALDLVLADEKSGPENTLTLITALRSRGALRATLRDRSDENLIPVLRWVLNNINAPRTLHLTGDVTGAILDMYAGRMGVWLEQGEGEVGWTCLKLVERIGKRVRRTAELAQQAEGCIGVMDLLAMG